MKALKTIKFLSLSVTLLSIAVTFSSVKAQEYDDMYFNKSDRKSVKVEKATVLSGDNNNNSATYKEISKSTETYSAKNVNPEYIARYKSTEANEVSDQMVAKNDSYSSDDYFVEGYDKEEYVSDPDKNAIDYAALNKRDQMSYSNQSRSMSSPSWRFSPYMSMGFGSPYGGGYGYDPFMRGYGSGMTIGLGMSYGFGYSPSMSYNIGMSYGSGYNPWGGWGGYPGYYNPYRMSSFYDPFGSMYGYNPYNSFGYSPYYGGGFGCSPYYGGYGSTSILTSNSGSEYYNGRNMQYKPRTVRTSAVQNSARTSSENVRTASSDSKIRVPARTVSASNGRVSKDYSKVQNEYYNTARRSSSSARRISSSTSNTNRNSYSRSSASASRYSSSINNNKPSRSSNYSTNSNRSSSYSGKSSGTSRSSYSSPSRSSSSYSSGSSGSRSSSFSSGSSSRSSSSSSGSRSSGSSRSGGRQ